MVFFLYISHSMEDVTVSFQRGGGGGGTVRFLSDANWFFNFMIIFFEAFITILVLFGFLKHSALMQIIF